VSTDCQNPGLADRRRQDEADVDLN
jgi:hypothetical protein